MLQYLYFFNLYFIFQNKMSDLSLMSRGLYLMLGEKLGTESIVDMRRRVMALSQSIHTHTRRNGYPNEDRILSGSICEGFRFASSDLDIMMVRSNMRVIFSLTQSRLYNNDKTLILADSEYTNPGFVLLRLLNQTFDHQLMCFCLKYGNRYYIASGKFRDFITSLTPITTSHGPCMTNVSGVFEMDHAVCLNPNEKLL